MNPVRQKIANAYQRILQTTDAYYQLEAHSATLMQDRLQSAHVALLIQGDIGRQILRQFINLPFKRLVVIGLTHADADYLRQLNQRMSDSRQQLVLIETPIENVALGFLMQKTQLVVSAAGRPFPKLATQINQASINTRTSWLHAHLWSVNFMLGPTFIPGVTACYECYHHRLLANSPQPEADEAIQLYLSQDQNFDYSGQFPAMNRMLGSFIVSETITYLTGRHQPKTLGEEMTIVPLIPSQGIGYNFVPRVEWCPACDHLFAQELADDSYTLESVVNSFVKTPPTLAERI